MKKINLFSFLFFAIIFSLTSANAQNNSKEQQQKVRTVTVPISIFTKQELRENQAEEFIQADRLLVKENKEEQTILSIKSVSNAPLSLAVLVQDDLTAN